MNPVYPFLLRSRDNWIGFKPLRIESFGRPCNPAYEKQSSVFKWICAVLYCCILYCLNSGHFTCLHYGCDCVISFRSVIAVNACLNNLTRDGWHTTFKFFENQICQPTMRLFWWCRYISLPMKTVCWKEFVTQSLSCPHVVMIIGGSRGRARLTPH